MTETGIKNASEFSSINRAADRLNPEVWPHINPSFTVPPGSTIFTIGSCFARNIEDNLNRLGFNVPTVGFRLPAEEYSGDTGNFFLNRYTPPSISQDVLWAHGLMQADDRFVPASCEKFMLETDDGKVVDLGHAPYIPVTRARFFERREEFYDLYKQMFAAECVTFTLGLVEAWLYKPTGVYIHSSPANRAMLVHREDFEFQRLGYPECHAHIAASIAAVQELNPEVKILITTSPVSLTKTFTQDDIITANMYSKSVLRAVAGKIADDTPGVDYFPSYESVTMTKTWDIWEPDFAHVKKAFVSKIVENLTRYYFAETNPVWVDLQRAHRLRYERKLEEAGQVARDAIAATAEPDARMLGFAADIMKSSRDWAAYEAILRRALALDRTAPQLEALATLMVDRQPAEAVALVDEAIDIGAASSRLRSLKARAQSAQGDLAGMEATLDSALIYAPDDANLMLAAADLWIKAGQIARAEALLRRALSKVRPYGANRVHGEIAKCRAIVDGPEAAKTYLQSLGVDLEKDKFLSRVLQTLVNPRPPRPDRPDRKSGV